MGVVIEDDGKAEDEFVAEIVRLNEELGKLNEEAMELEGIISKNIAQTAGG